MASIHNKLIEIENKTQRIFATNKTFNVKQTKNNILQLESATRITKTTGHLR